LILALEDQLMSGNVWIVLGVIAIAFSSFAIPYGFYKRSEKQSEASPHTTGDYIVGQKTVVNQTVQVDGGFVQIGRLADTGSTGVFVNLALDVANYVAEKGTSWADLNVDDYLEWTRKQREQDPSTAGQRNLLTVLEGEVGQASAVRACIERVIVAVKDQREQLATIMQHTKSLPDMDSKLDYLVEQLSKKDSLSLCEGQIGISARVLDTLTTGVVGSGVKIMMRNKINAYEGSAMVVWLLGTQSPQMMLLDLVGDVKANRLSVILNADTSVSLRAYDGGGIRRELKSDICLPEQHLVVLAVWKDHRLSLWLNGRLQASGSMSKGFDYLGPLCLFGMDIEGELSADGVRWTPEGENVGLNFMKDGIWHGSRYDSASIWERALEKPEIETLAQDPWVGFRSGR
jgi:hypothetical protein